jgi:hypothetical protein
MSIYNKLNIITSNASKNAKYHDVCIHISTTTPQILFSLRRIAYFIDTFIFNLSEFLMFVCFSVPEFNLTFELERFLRNP